MSSPAAQLRGRRIGSLLRRPARAVQAHITTQLAERGFEDLTEAHMALFIHIDPEGSRLTQLAERAHVKPVANHLEIPELRTNVARDLQPLFVFSGD